MSYKELAEDLHEHFKAEGLDQITLVGHSLGAKTAMTYASLFPADVSGIVSLDASPVDRNLYPSLNASSQRMIEDALAVGNLTGLTEKEAKMAISRRVVDPILQSALLFNLREDGSFSCNLEAIYSN